MAADAGRYSSTKEVFLDNDYKPLRDVAAEAGPSRSSTTGLRNFAGSASSTLQSFLAPAISPMNAAAARFEAWRDKMDLPYPGTAEQLGRESKSRSCESFADGKSTTRLGDQELTDDDSVLLDVHLTNYMFDGARADLTKSLNANPAFQVTHAFSLGQSHIPAMGAPPVPGGPGTYNFGAFYATNNVSLSPSKKRSSDGSLDADRKSTGFRFSCKVELTTRAS